MTWGLEGATVRYGARVALDAVTFGAEPSGIHVIVGGDAAGKSTLLAALVGLVPLDDGEARRPSKDRIGYVPATAGLYGDLTVEENLEFSAGAYGLGGGELASRATALLERIGLESVRNRLASQLSGGMARKLAVGTALLHRPDLVVLDEPTTGVDPLSRAELWRLIAGAAAAGAAVVVATTYVDEAARATRVALLDAGRVLVEGSPGEIIASVPGAIGTSSDGRRPPGRAWRWGATWRVWAPDGRLPDGAERVEPTFDDAVLVASLADEGAR